MASEHNDFEPFELGENMQEDLGMFEAATHARRLQLEQNPVGHVMVVVDEGPLAPAVRELGQTVARRLDASVSEHAVASEQVHEAASGIREAAEKSGAGLIVISFPCGVPLDTGGDESLGEVADHLLQSVTLPLLCVRNPPEPSGISQTLDCLQVAAIRDDDSTRCAISWAFRLADSQTQIHLVELADRTAIEEAQRLLQAREEIASVQKAAIERAITSRMGSLVGMAQREASEKNIELQVSFHLGTPALEVLVEMKRHACGMMIIPRPADHTASGYHLVIDVLLKAGQPVLVI